MLGQATIPSKTLAMICRRLSITLSAGVDIRRAWATEANNASWPLRARMRAIVDDLNVGTSLEDAIEKIQGVFPMLFREMVEVGEKTGSLPEVLRRLATHYEHQTKVKRQFLAGITWPMIQFALALFVVGVLIYLPTVLAQGRGGKAIDLLGIGLTGPTGLTIYLATIAMAAILIALLLVALRRGALWARPMQTAAMRLPAIRGALETMALARITWTMELTLGVAMDLQHLLPLALRSTGNYYYTQHSEEAARMVAGGDPIHVAMVKLGIFPSEFLAAVEVGEESGSLSETMGHLSQSYEEQSQAALAVLTKVASMAVWLCVASAIIAVIFRLFSFYVGMINDALEM